jgi:drug/metabolite transporter (DMT)-like permease
MTAVGGGLLAAVFWGVSTAVAARASRLVGARVALSWVYATGLVVAAAAAAATDPPEIDREGIGWTALAAFGGISSLFLLYAALRLGPVVLVTPVNAAQGGLAALLAVALGERLHGLAAAGLGVMTLGMYAVLRRPAAVHATAHPTSAILVAAASAGLAALGLYAAARAGDALGAAWLLLVLRTAGVVSMMAPLAATGSLRGPGAALRLVVFCGLADTAALAGYLIGATRGSVAVTAVIASQYAAVSVLVGVVAMGERLTRIQVAGIAAILGGVALVTAVQT